MKLKNALFLLLISMIFLIASFGYSVFAENYIPVQVFVNNNPMQYGISPVNIDGEVYVPLKETSEGLQLESRFDIKTLTAVIKMGENEINLKLDSNVAILNGKYIQLPSTMRIIRNRVMVPVKVFENLGMYLTSRDGTVLIFKPESGKIIYRVVNGDYLWKISQMFGTSYITIKSLNNMSSDVIYVGQYLIVKMVPPFQTNFDAIAPVNATLRSGPGFEYAPIGYLTAGSGVKITGKNGNWFKVSTPKGLGYMYYTVIKIIQEISDTTPQSTYFSSKIPVDTSTNTITYINYTVVAGDTLWGIAEKMGIPVQELMEVNGLTANSYLKVGQILKVPVHNIPVKQTLGPNYGEILDWFEEGQYVFPIGKVGKLIDLETGLSFNVQRTMGSSHSDTETLTANDTAIMKQIFGGTWTWSRRPFILEVDGRRFAVSVSGMPHAGVDGQPFLQNVYNRSGGYGYGPNYDRISGNQMDGHFDLYFLNGLRHLDNQIDPEHQKMVSIAGGLQ